MRVVGKIASIGVLAGGLLVGTASSAFADVSGAYAGVDWNVRASASTNSAVVARISASDAVPCWTATCTGEVRGGSYKCSGESATYNTWTPLNYKGRKTWVANRCVSLGRIG